MDACEPKPTLEADLITQGFSPTGAEVDLASPKAQLTASQGSEGCHNTGPLLKATTGHLERLFPRLLIDLHPKS